MLTFQDYFNRAMAGATEMSPFPFQEAFATADELPALVDVPTGLGKTAMAVLGWFWRRRFAPDAIKCTTPRRLVYCLPMRVLVEQTRDNADRWLSSLKAAGLLSDDLRAYVLMGGEDEPEWDIYPERDAIIIGTQDMLLSRALNRGYAASRARWPMHFGLLNTDCLWVFDEVQLMGSGLATTAQLEAFRRQLTPTDENRGSGLEGNGCKSVWMSATLRPDWLRTVDFKSRVDDLGRIDGKATLTLSDEERKNNEEIKLRWNAEKPLSKATSSIGNPGALASEVRNAHKPGTRTIIVVNTVERACDLFHALSKASTPNQGKGGKGKRTAGTLQPDTEVSQGTPSIVLLHSRFRPPDRAKRVAEALADVDPNGPGTIVVSTQVIEAGVDVSATTLFTELAPWASLVQRFGRCNRRGEQNAQASVKWIDLPTGDAHTEKARHPYELADLRTAAEELAKLEDVGPASLAAHREALSEEEQKALFPHRHIHVIRRKDLLDLFDTTPDLTGNDIDIDRYVREVEDTDVRVFWRDYGDPKKGATPNNVNGKGTKVEPAPLRDELCSVPIGAVKQDSSGKKPYTDFRSFVRSHAHRVWRWNFTEKGWEQAEPDSVAPGQVFLIHVDAGGYSPERGWTAESADVPSLDQMPTQARSDEAEGYDDDHESQADVWQTIAEHTRDVCGEMACMLSLLAMPADTRAVLHQAALWHDWGKAHRVFQDAVTDVGRPNGRAEQRTVAKAPNRFWLRYTRKHFRHELASALAVLQRPHDSLQTMSDDDLNLIAYLIAAHHGKVRLSIRSMPNEVKPPVNEREPLRRFARGVWDGDTLPSVDLGGGVVAPGVTLSLEPMELGLCESEPFTGQPSWVERVLRLRDRFGPFRLAYLEAILRAADGRASANAAKSAEVNRG